MILNQPKTLFLLCLLLLTGRLFAQSGSDSRLGCSVSITCPGNVVSYADPGTCATVVTYADPVTTTTCGVSNTMTFNYTGSLQTFIVPSGVTQVYITASGAQGGSISTNCVAAGGKGARVEGNISVTPGDALTIMVGQQGLTNGSDAGGGGGTFVVGVGNMPLMIAGGGGGATNNIGSCGTNLAGLDGQSGTSGTNSGNGIVAGGTAGNGGGASGGSGGGGGGFLTDGMAGAGLANNNGKSYMSGGAGGTGNNNDSGGYGGGGAGWFTGGNGGGGGGYSGGATSGNQPFTGGGGGGSYNSSTSPTSITGFQTGNGQATISYIIAAPAYTVLTQGGFSGSSFPVGLTTVAYLGTDSSTANDDSCSFTVTVLDTVPPSITCPSNIVASNDPGTCTATVTYTAPVGTDDCPGTTSVLQSGLASGSAFSSGVNTIVYEAEDPSANLSTCSFTVTVVVDDSSTQTLSICNGQSVTVGSSTYSTAGTYTDVLANGGGCDSVVTTHLTVAAPINITTTTAGPVISAQASGAAYQWVDCNNGNAPVSGATGQSFTPAQSGTYAVIVTVGSCSDTSACEVVVGISGAQASKYALYPNPTSGQVSISYGATLEAATIEVFDLAGKRLLVRDEINVAESRVDFSNLGNGVYFVKVTSANGQDVLRVVKQD